jgi:hypothetical protein
MVLLIFNIMSKIIKKVSEFIGRHPDSKIVVCGCGVSLLTFKDHAKDFITIGVNDVSKLFTPNYLVVTDSPMRFGEKRRTEVNASQASYLFTCAKGWRHPNIVSFELGRKGGKSLDNPSTIDHFVNSPYVAVGLAYKLGAKTIGVIGVDFTDGHFYNPKDGPHPVIQINYLKKVNSAYQAIAMELDKRGIKIYNLSSSSRVELPKMTIEEFKTL